MQDSRKNRWIGGRGMAIRAAAGLLATIVCAASARAAPTPEDRALATELFNQGRELAVAGKHAEACPKFAESHRLDPGGGTVLNLALCYEAMGKLASAYSALNDALALARRDNRDDRVQVATEHLVSVEPRLSRLIIEVPSESELPGLVIRRDGSEVARAAWGSAMPVDGGAHLIEASAPSRMAWSTTVDVLVENDKKTVSVPKLEVEPKPAPAPPPVPVSPAPKKPVTIAHPARDASSGSTQRVLGFVVGGVGVVGIGAGTYFGLHAYSKRDDSAELCVNGCTVRGAELSREAATAADWSTASFALGIATLGVGAYLVLSAGDARNTTQVGVLAGPTGMAVHGWF